MGMGKKSSVSLAALVNGTAVQAFELDDIHKESIVHAGSIATPIALGYAEQKGGASGRDVITAMTAQAAVDNSAPFAIRPESTYKSGKVVQTNGATSHVTR
jgi:2-methylcitrate dehydratase PrpD